MKTKTIRLLLVPVMLLAAAFSQSTAQSQRNLDDESCQAIVARALDTIQNFCTKVARNSACYGHDQINVEFTDKQPLKFEQRGDKVPIQAIRTLTTSSMNVEKGTWGLSVLKIQANLPDTMPGQNITFLVYGDTSIENASGDMQVFYFASALGRPTCKEMPAEGIVVKSPNNMQVAFTANGVKIKIASTIFLQAKPNQSMSVSLIEGHATVETSEGSATLQPGQTVSVPMGGASGLEPTGAPSIPVSTNAQTQTALAPIVDAVTTGPINASPIVTATAAPTAAATSVGNDAAFDKGKDSDDKAKNNNENKDKKDDKDKKADKDKKDKK